MSNFNNVTNIENDISTLPDLFKQGLDLFNNLGKTDEPTNSSSVQYNVKKCIKIFEKATILCSYADIFSNNEGIQEVATSNLQYFLLPALLGSLHLKLTLGERRNIVEVSEVYFTDFMKRCVEYELCKYEFKKETEKEEEKTQDLVKPLTEMEELTILARRRAVKICRYKEQQELKKRLEELKKNMENDHVDEDIKRNYFLTMIKLYIYEARDELSSLELEKTLLDHMAKIKKEEKPKPRKRPAPPLRPIVITKDIIQKKVYGAGYPSLPIMSVQDFYSKRMKEGIFPDPTKIKERFMSLQEAAMRNPPQDPEDEQLDDNVDTDDYHILEAMRQKDEFKDTHRRGWGNRMNRS